MQCPEAGVNGGFEEGLKGSGQGKQSERYRNSFTDMLGPSASASPVTPSPEAGPCTQSSQCVHPVTPYLLGFLTPSWGAGACTRSACLVAPSPDMQVRAHGQPGACIPSKTRG